MYREGRKSPAGTYKPAAVVSASSPSPGPAPAKNRSDDRREFGNCRRSSMSPSHDGISSAFAASDHIERTPSW